MKGIEKFEILNIEEIPRLFKAGTKQGAKIEQDIIITNEEDKRK